RDVLMASLETSLSLMNTDHVDLIQLHNPLPEDQERYDIIGTLKEMQSQGLTRSMGISTTLPEIVDFLATGAFDVFQLPYSALEPDHRDVITQIAKAGAGTVIRGGIGEGAPWTDHYRRERHVQVQQRWRQANIDGIGAGIPS